MSQQVRRSTEFRSHTTTHKAYTCMCACALCVCLRSICVLYVCTLCMYSMYVLYLYDLSDIIGLGGVYKRKPKRQGRLMRYLQEKRTRRPYCLDLSPIRVRGCPHVFFPDWASAQGSLLVWYSSPEDSRPPLDFSGVGKFLFAVFSRQPRPNR